MSDWVLEKRSGVPVTRANPFMEMLVPNRSVVCATDDVRLREYTHVYWLMRMSVYRLV